MEFVGMFIICSPTKLNMPRYKGSILLPWRSDPKKIIYAPYCCFKTFRSTACFWNALPHWIQDPVWSSMFISHKWYDMIYLLTAIGLSPGGRSAVHIYTHTIHRTIQNKQYIEQHNKLEECGPCPVLTNFTLQFALQPRKKHGKTSVRVAASKNTYTTISTHRQQ